MNEQLTVKNLFGKDEVRNKFQEMLGKRAPSFITSVLQIVASNALLAKADPHSVYHSAAVAATLDLPLNNNLGFAAIVPYNQKQPDGSYKQVAQFQMQYKGFIQLAQRSGQFATINATDVRQGEIKSQDKLTGSIDFEWIQDEEQRLKLPIIGFVSYMRLLNGFEKSNYMSLAKLKEHGLKYSQSFKKGYGLWQDNFDAMALKTVLKLLLSKYAPLSVDIQRAVVLDQAVINNEDATDITYADNEQAEIDKESERIALMIGDAKTVEELEAISEHVKETQLDLYTVKMDELKTKKKNGK
jgi:recombination protein RecT